MSVPGISRSNALLVVLFATAFFGMLVFSKVTAEGGQEGWGGASLTRPNRVANSSSPAAQIAQPPQTVTSAATSSSPSNIAPPPPSAEQIREYQQASRVALDAEEGEDRGVAIRKLESARTPEAVASLVQVLRNDSDVRNRLLAISALGSLARSGYDATTIRSELETATHESDPNVASHAEEAYQELMAPSEK